jgi:ComF family protein
MNYRGRSGWLSILPQPDGLKALARHFRNALLPGSCLLCSADSRGELFCPECSTDLPTLLAALCPLCADQTTHGERCGACLREAPHFDRTVALFRYDFPVDRIIHALKYGHQLAVADWCGQRLAARIGPEQFDWIIPLPLHAERLRERGFNQSAEIARVLGNCLDLPVDRAPQEVPLGCSNLLRTRATPPQADLPHKERHKNVRGAFECRADFTGQRLLLIDDVMTTGATVNECARVLKLHGAASVTVGVVARALRH